MRLFGIAFLHQKNHAAYISVIEKRYLQFYSLAIPYIFYIIEIFRSNFTKTIDANLQDETCACDSWKKGWEENWMNFVSLYSWDNGLTPIYNSVKFIRTRDSLLLNSYMVHKAYHKMADYQDKNL